MIYSTYKAGNLVEKVKIPENWNDVPFHKYPDFVELCENGVNGTPEPKEVFKLMLGISQRMVDSNFKISMLEAMNQQLNFLSIAPTVKKRATHFRFKGNNVRVPNSVSEMKLGKYRDIIETCSAVLTGEEKSVSAMLKTFPEVIAIFCAPEGYTQTDLDDMSEEIAKFPTPEILVLGNFFMNQFVNLKNGTSANWFKKLIKTITPTSQLASVKLLKISATF
tara:strand:+ start:283 stop:945 length:663 start_codon:yes stop_codon:yes gene_type:complete